MHYKVDFMLVHLNELVIPDTISPTIILIFLTYSQKEPSFKRMKINQFSILIFITKV